MSLRERVMLYMFGGITIALALPITFARPAVPISVEARVVAMEGLRAVAGRLDAVGPGGWAYADGTAPWVGFARCGGGTCSVMVFGTMGGRVSRASAVYYHNRLGWQMFMGSLKFEDKEG